MSRISFQLPSFMVCFDDAVQDFGLALEVRVFPIMSDHLRLDLEGTLKFFLQPCHLFF